jgi:hypothetical protein
LWDGSFFQANRVTLFCTLIKSGGARFGFWDLVKSSNKVDKEGHSQSQPIPSGFFLAVCRVERHGGSRPIAVRAITILAFHDEPANKVAASYAAILPNWMSDEIRKFKVSICS